MVLRSSETSRLLGHRVLAPSTLGTFLRSFTFGNVRQLDRVLAQSLRRAWQAGAGPGTKRLVVDVDSFVCEVHGAKKQGTAYGYYTRQLGYLKRPGFRRGSRYWFPASVVRRAVAAAWVASSSAGGIMRSRRGGVGG